MRFGVLGTGHWAQAVHATALADHPSAELVGVWGRDLAKAKALNEMASGRGMTLAQLALAWILRRPEITSALIGASSVAQLEQNLATLTFDALGESELASIEEILG